MPHLPRNPVLPHRAMWEQNTGRPGSNSNANINSFASRLVCAYHPGCHSPVQRQIFQANNSYGSPACQWATVTSFWRGTNKEHTHLTHEVATPTVNPDSADNDDQPWFTGPQLLYCDGLPMGSHLRPRRTPPVSCAHGIRARYLPTICMKPWHVART